MERNQRPITVQVLIRLAGVYGIDPRDFIESEGERSAGEIKQILADPLFREAAIPRGEVRDAAENSPALVAATARLYRAYAAAQYPVPPLALQIPPTRSAHGFGGMQSN